MSSARKPEHHAPCHPPCPAAPTPPCPRATTQSCRPPSALPRAGTGQTSSTQRSSTPLRAGAAHRWCRLRGGHRRGERVCLQPLQPDPVPTCPDSAKSTPFLGPDNDSSTTVDKTRSSFSPCTDGTEAHSECPWTQNCCLPQTHSLSHTHGSQPSSNQLAAPAGISHTAPLPGLSLQMPGYWQNYAAGEQSCL